MSGIPPSPSSSLYFYSILFFFSSASLYCQNILYSFCTIFSQHTLDFRLYFEQTTFSMAVLLSSSSRYITLFFELLNPQSTPVSPDVFAIKQGWVGDRVKAETGLKLSSPIPLLTLTQFCAWHLSPSKPHLQNLLLFPQFAKNFLGCFGMPCLGLIAASSCYVRGRNADFLEKSQEYIVYSSSLSK